jgi:hypothetical protein
MFDDFFCRAWLPQRDVWGRTQRKE